MFLKHILLFTIIVPNVLCILPRLIQCVSGRLIVDWFLIYKLPKNATSSFPDNLKDELKEGTAYLEANSRVHPFLFYHQQGSNITSPDTILATTLAPLYKQNRDEKLEWILYNDQPPNKPYIADFGHAKGVLLFNDKEGIWLIHSVPHFPPEPNAKYAYPKTGYRYGHQIFCISITKKEFDNIGLQLKFNEINVYSHKISNVTATLYPNLADAARQVRINNGETFRRTEFISSQSRYKFQSFAKTSKWGKELWSDLVAASLNVSFHVQSWLNEADRLNFTCNGTQNIVENVKSGIWKAYNQYIFINSTNDHSKWATDEFDFRRDFKGPPWVCIGDINRAKNQFNRGGGAVCWKMYYGLTHTVEECPETTN